MSNSMAIAYRMKRRKMAEGGNVGDDMISNEGKQEIEQIPTGDDDDMINRIMMSRGGMVANDVGVAEADKLPAEYDDLVLRDDLEDNSSAGNEHGNEALDHEDADIISRIMRSRSKKDRMPRPA